MLSKATMVLTLRSTEGLKGPHETSESQAKTHIYPLICSSWGESEVFISFPKGSMIPKKKRANTHLTITYQTGSFYRAVSLCVIGGGNSCSQTKQASPPEGIYDWHDCRKSHTG